MKSMTGRIGMKTVSVTTSALPFSDGRDARAYMLTCHRSAQG